MIGANCHADDAFRTGSRAIILAACTSFSFLRIALDGSAVAVASAAVASAAVAVDCCCCCSGLRALRINSIRIS